MATILANPRYTGRQVRNRQRTDTDLADPADIALGHKQVQRWNLPGGWVISARPAFPALASEAGFIAAQDISAARGPAATAGPATPHKRRYLLAACLRDMRAADESAWSNGKAAYRCRHGHTSAAPPGPGRAGNAHVRGEPILPQLPGVCLLLTGADPGAPHSPRDGRATAASAEDVIGYLREHGLTLTWAPAAATLQASATEPIKTATGKGS